MGTFSIVEQQHYSIYICVCVSVCVCVCKKTAEDLRSLKPRPGYKTTEDLVSCPDPTQEERVW